MVGFKKENTKFVPISGFAGDNLIAPSKKLTWWTGPTFLETVRQLVFSIPLVAGLSQRIKLVTASNYGVDL